MRAPPSKRPSRVCRIERVWSYPSTEDNAGPVKWAWACRCGKTGINLADEEKARASATQHFDAGQPNG